MPAFGRQLLSIAKTLKNNVFSARGFVAPLAILGVISGSTLAYANYQNYDEAALSVSTRQLPAYTPSGIRLGDFNLSPSISNALSFTDNVYATEIEQVHDTIYTVRPEFNLSSDFVRHGLNAGFYLEKGFYKDNEDEDYTDYGANVGGRIDISGQTSVPIAFSIDQWHVRRGSPDPRAGLEPTVYKIYNGTVGLIHQGQRVAFKMIAELKRYMFDDGVGLAGNIDNGDQNRNEYSIYNSIGLNEDSIVAPFVYTKVTDIDYSRAFDLNGFDKDAMQYEAGIGTIINLSKATTASFSIGRVQRDLADDAYSDISGYNYGIDLKWEPSTLMAFLLQGDRTINESLSDGTSARIDSALRLSADYELFPNLIVQPSAGIVESVYKGGAGGKTERVEGGVQINYKMNQNLSLSTSYRYINLDEKEPAPDVNSYESNNYGVSLRLQF